MDVQLVLQEFESEWTAPDLNRVQALIDKRLIDNWDAHQVEIEQLKEQQPDVHKRASEHIKAIRDRLAAGGPFVSGKQGG